MALLSARMANISRIERSRKIFSFLNGPYSRHFCLGILYDRAENAAIDEINAPPLDELHSITSGISNIQFFVAEEWKIAGDKGGFPATQRISVASKELRTFFQGMECSLS